MSPLRRPRLHLTVAYALTLALLPAAASTTARRALAQAPSPATAEATHRAFFIPEPGLSNAARAVLREGVASEPPLARSTRDLVIAQSGVRAQNLGERPTRILAIYHRPDGPRGDDCTGCAFAGARCSNALAPGETTRLSPWWSDGDDDLDEPLPVTGLVAAVYALNDRPAADYGPAWRSLLREAGLDEEASVADVVCGVFAGEVDLGWNATCPSSAWLAAFTGGTPLPFAPAASSAALPGEPIGVVVAPPVETGSPSQPAATIDRYRAPGLAEVDTPLAPGALGTPADFGAADGIWVYELPGAVGNNPEDVHSLAHLQNIGSGAGCATVRVEAWRTGGSFRGAITATIASGAWASLDARRPEWELTGSANLRVISDQPLATALTTRGYGFSLSRPGTPAEEIARTQLVPMAYQALRPFFASDLHAPRLMLDRWTAPSSHGFPGTEPSHSPTLTQEPTARGWETNIAAFNPTPERRDLVLRLQGAGRPARESGFPLEPHAQLIFQPGFGLGKPGGPGWAEITARTIDARAPAPISVGVDALRSATDVPFLLAAWGVPSEPHGPAPSDDHDPARARTIGLPSLGGPALGDPNGSSSPTPPMVVGSMAYTTTLAARIAVQNPTTRTARVAIDAYAACGLAGTTELQLDPRQSTHLPVHALEGIAFAPDSAVIRILEGEVAAVLEVQHAARSTFAEAPLDLSTAYHGAPSPLALEAPPEPSVLPGIGPPSLEFDTTTGPLSAPIDVVSVAHDGCFTWRADSTSPWLELTPPTGPFPGAFTARVLPAALPPPAPGEDTIRGTIDVIVLSPDGPAAPLLTVSVTVRTPPNPRIHLPYLTR